MTADEFEKGTTREPSPVRKRHLAEATRNLGYHRVPPQSSTLLREDPWWMQPTQDALERMAQNLVKDEIPVALLRSQIEKLGVSPHGRSRLKLARQYVEVLLDPARLHVALERLTPEAREYFIHLLLNDRIYNRGFADVQIFIGERPTTPRQMLREEIAEVGLALPEEDFLAIPPPLFSRLPPLYLSLPGSMMMDPDEVQEPVMVKIHRSIAQTQQFLALLQSEIYTLRPRLQWTASEAGPARFVKGLLPTPESARMLKKRISATSLKIEMLAPDPQLDDETLAALGEALGLSEPAVEFVYGLLLKTGLVRPGSPVTLEQRTVEHFLTLSTGRQLALLILHYANMSDWSVFWPLWREGRVQAHWDFRFSYRYVDFQEELGEAILILRYVLLQYLAVLPHEIWLPLDEILQPLLQFLPEGNMLTSAGNLSFTAAGRGWEGFLELFVQAVLKGPLHWLGIADVDLSVRQRVRAFRLHHLQDILWQREDEFPVPEVSWDAAHAVTWDDEENSLLLTPPVPVAVLRLVQQWARPAGASEETLRYHLDVDRLHAAFEDGVSPADLVERWEHEIGVSPPASVVAWWERWWKRYGHVRLYPHRATLVAQDSFALQELQVALPELRDALLGLVNRRMAVLDPQALTDIVAAMEEKGYIPKVED
ncbi:MAG: hypothetical protein ACP5GX_07620 [Anaerolineae bacterium]